MITTCVIKHLHAYFNKKKITIEKMKTKGHVDKLWSVYSSQGRDKAKKPLKKYKKNS